MVGWVGEWVSGWVDKWVDGWVVCIRTGCSLEDGLGKVSLWVDTVLSQGRNLASSVGYISASPGSLICKPLSGA